MLHGRALNAFAPKGAARQSAPPPRRTERPALVEVESLAMLGVHAHLPAAEAARLERAGRVRIVREPALRYRLDHRGRVDPTPEVLPPWKR